VDKCTAQELIAQRRIGLSIFRTGNPGEARTRSLETARQHPAKVCCAAPFSWGPVHPKELHIERYNWVHYIPV
jgi:hypothetical protein